MLIRDCTYCLCKRCNKIQCPRGRYHCMPCYHGTVLECAFFMNKQSTRIYHIKKRSPAVTVEDLEKLRDTIDIILSNGKQTVKGSKTLQQKLTEEEQRHKAALREILKNGK